jgi:small-conductance mechanosensitive channel
MNTIENFNKENLKNIRQDITESLKEISEKYGIEISVGNISYHETQMSFPVKAIVLNENTNGKKEMFKRACVFYGLTESDFGKRFVSNSKTFEVDGLDPKKNKYPLIAKCLTDGKKYKFPVEQYKLLTR